MTARIRKSVARMQGYTPGEQPRKAGLLKLNTNENPYPPSPRVQEALASFDAASLRLYPDPQCVALRERVAEIHGCRPEHVFVGNGSDEVLALCTRAFVEDAGAVGFFDPSYSLYPVLAEIRDVACRPVPLPEDFGWTMPAGYAASLFFLTNPNAPSGVQYPLAAVRAFCRAFEGVVVLDEAYVDFAPENGMAIACELPNVLAARTLSKSFALAGLRVGYAVGAPELIAALMKVKDSYNLDALSQRLALAALSDLAHMRGTAARIRATRDELARELGALGFVMPPSSANFLWVRHPERDAADLQARLRERDILVRHFPGPRTGAHLRITIGRDEDMARLLRAVREILGLPRS